MLNDSKLKNPLYFGVYRAGFASSETEFPIANPYTSAGEIYSERQVILDVHYSFTPL